MAGKIGQISLAGRLNRSQAFHQAEFYDIVALDVTVAIARACRHVDDVSRETGAPDRRRRVT
jgi:hypothetical protein